MTVTQATLLAFAAIPAVSFGCCMAFDPAHPMVLADEKAIIIWEEAKKTQHFIRSATFKGDAEHFGFIVPTPNRPDVVDVDPKVFGELERFVQRSLHNRSNSGMKGLEAGTAATDGSVQVLAQMVVGDFDVTILKAADGGALNGWLKENGYQSRPAMTPWLDHYAKRSWIFTALKFRRDKIAEENANSTEFRTRAIRLSFQADAPHYPYMMPSDTWPAGHVRPLSLYILSSTEMGARYVASRGKWEANPVFAGPAGDAFLESVARSLKMKDGLPKTMMLTAFLNRENPTGYGEDLTFVKQTAPSTVSYVIAGVAALGIGYFGWRLLRR
jgi:hypothetical protein